MTARKKKSSPRKDSEIEAEEWDISEGMGILPDEINLTQNIGCVGGKPKKPSKTTDKPTK